MSLFDELYTKREYFDDLAECQRILRLGREGCADGTIQGLELMVLEANVAAMVKKIRLRWALNARWFGALAKAKRDWAMKVFGEHDHESLKRLAFLRAVVARLLEGMPERLKERLIAMPEGMGPWARERLSHERNRGFMPDCDYEICTGGRWMPVHKADLPDKVRWV